MARLGTEDSGGSGQQEVDLFDLSIQLWHKRRIIVWSAVAGLIAASLYLHVATYLYTAELTVLPVQSGGGGLASKLGSLSDIASLTGITLPQDQSSTQFQLYLEGVHTRTVADALAPRADLMKVLFKNQWDAKTNTWRRPEGILTPIKKALKFLLGVPDYPWQPPNGAQLQVYLEKEVTVTQVPQKPFVTIAYQNKDPAFAVKFLASLHEAVETRLRQKALSKSKQYIDYLTGKLRTVTVAEQRQAILNALNDQEKSMMAASSDAPFAAESFGAPSASFRPTSPVPIVVLAVGLLGGTVLAMGFILLNAVRPLPAFEWPEWGFSRWSGLVRRLMLRKQTQ